MELALHGRSILLLGHTAQTAYHKYIKPRQKERPGYMNVGERTTEGDRAANFRWSALQIYGWKEDGRGLSSVHGMASHACMGGP